RTKDGYALTFDTEGGPQTVSFARVVIATGRFNRPTIPPIPGDESFSGECGIIHTFDYKDPSLYRDKHVVVAGGSISALEIASDLSMLGAASVRLAQRRQRYVNPKMVRGVPIEYFAFTYARGDLCLGPDKAALAKNDQEIVMRFAGDPSRYGTPKPHADFAKAGVTGSQHYLNLVAEGRVRPVPWITRIEGRTLTFEDGTTAECDGIIAGTGFALNLPFLSTEIAGIVDLTPTSISLDEFTLHPDLPGLAFVGLWSQLGSYPTPLELQARYLSYVWSGRVPRDDAAMRAGVARCQNERHHTGYRRQNEMALRFARLSGADPSDQVDPGLMAKVRQSATTAIMYRLAGPDALDSAPAEFDRVLARYGPANA
ncbi:MAG: NAD(P)-binding domain-containing protein, partial [Pseudomonadota bacterium]